MKPRPLTSLRWTACRALVALALFLTPAHTEAQVALVSAADSDAAAEIEPGISEGMRDGLGASVRRIALSLEDLALAAGCAATPRAPSCIARIAAAADARLLAIERVSRHASEYVVEVELRRGADGSTIRVVRLECASSVGCRGRLDAALGNEEPERVRAPQPHVELASVTLEIDEPPRIEERHTRGDSPLGHPVPLAPSLLLGTSAVLGLGALVAGGVAIGLEQARGISSSDTVGTAQAQQLAALRTSSDWALGLGTAFASVGACLAVAGTLLLALSPPGHTQARLHVSGVVSTSFTLFSLDASF